MGKTTHTPGPWKSERNAGGGKTIFSENLNIIFVGDFLGLRRDENERLVTTAPELLAALQDCYDVIGCYVTESLTVSRESEIALRRAKYTMEKADGQERTDYLS